MPTAIFGNRSLDPAELLKHPDERDGERPKREHRQHFAAGVLLHCSMVAPLLVNALLAFAVLLLHIPLPLIHFALCL